MNLPVEHKKTQARYRKYGGSVPRVPGRRITGASVDFLGDGRRFSGGRHGSTLVELEFSRQRKEPLSGKAVPFENHDRGEEGPTVLMFMTGDLAQDDRDLISVIRISHIETCQRCNPSVCRHILTLGDTMSSL